MMKLENNWQRNPRLAEAARIKEIAVSKYAPGIVLLARFKDDGNVKDVRYVNPRDIPLRVQKDYRTLYLWSVGKI